MATGMNLGTRIRQARESKLPKMSQQKLADLLHVSVRAVSDWENDKAVPRSSKGALEKVLGISIYGGDDDTRGLPPIVAANADIANVMSIWASDMTLEMRLKSVEAFLYRYHPERFRDAVALQRNQSA